MSGVWSTPTLEITVPSNVSPIPGSGAIYLGGPQLPAELRSYGYTAGLVWFAGNTSFLKYWFMARESGVDFERWSFGYCDNAGTLVFLDNAVGYAAPDNYLLRSITNLATLTGLGLRGSLRLGTPGNPTGTVMLLANFSVTTQDGWNTSSTTQTFGGVANCTVKIDWRWTPDYIMDLRFSVSCPSAPTGSTASANLPATVPAIDLSPGGMGVLGAVSASQIGARTAMTARLTTTQVQVYIATNPNGNTLFEGSFTTTLNKTP